MNESQNIEYKESWRDEYLKWICGFANAQGGRIFIGINDRQQVIGVPDSKKLLEDIPNKIVNYLGIVADVNLLQSDEGKDYIEIVVEPSNIPIAYHGQYHYRSGSTKQELKGAALQQFILKKMGISWDDIVQPSATLDAIDPAAVDYLQRSAISHGRMMASDYSSDVKTVLENLDLIDEEGHLRNAAILLFGKRPSRYFTLCDFRIGRFIKDETDLIFQDVIEGDIIRMADKVISILRSKYLTTPIHYEGLERFEPLEIPEKALREAIFNAIIHKDYSGVHIQMKVYNDHIELWNQGSLPAGWTVEKMLAPHSSQPRNKHIAAAFYKAGFIESWGRGISKIIEGFVSAGLPAPTFEEHCGGLLLTIPRRIAGGKADEGINEGVNEGINEGANVKIKLSEKEKAILRKLRENPYITHIQIASQLSVSAATVNRAINRLQNEGLVVRKGSKKSGYWLVQ